MTSGALRVVLMLVIGILLGALLPPVHLFVNQQFANTRAFFQGHPLEPETTPWQKIENDLGIAPWRATRNPAAVNAFDFDTVALPQEYSALLPESSLELFLDRSSPVATAYAGMLIKSQGDTGRGYSPQLLLVGFDGKLHKLISLQGDSDCDCNASRPLNYFHIDGDPAELHRSGNRLINLNSCGGIDWSVDSRYSFHHYLNNDGDHRQADFWILDATDLVQIETASGRILQRIALGEIVNANPGLPIFEARLRGTRPDRWLYGAASFEPVGRTHSEVENADPDPFHTNDIDSYLGDDTGVFANGDLVLSFRSLNLITVIRPQTRKIIWYAYGLTSRQHDPDFTSANSVMVYDNNFHNAESRITLLQASADSSQGLQVGTRRTDLVRRIEDQPFQQLIEGYQFYLEDQRSLILSAESHNYGIDTLDKNVFLALRHRWREQAFLAVDIERILARDEFEAIKSASCR